MKRTLLFEAKTTFFKKKNNNKNSSTWFIFYFDFFFVNEKLNAIFFYSQAILRPFYDPRDFPTLAALLVSGVNGESYEFQK